MSPRLTDKAPQISVLNWVLGGSLITIPANRHKAKGHKKSTEKAANMEEVKEADQKDAKKEENKPPSEEAPSTSEKTPSESATTTTTSKTTTPPARDSSGNLIWSDLQDALLLSLKASNKPWKEILAVLKTSKRDAQARWRVLREGESGEEVGGEEEKGKGKGKEKERGKERKGEGRTEGGSGSGRMRLRADEVWSQRDCEMLEMLEARYTDQKWLQIQAGFYNLTGRMVVGSIIERKFQTG